MERGRRRRRKGKGELSETRWEMVRRRRKSTYWTYRTCRYKGFGVSQECG